MKPARRKSEQERPRTDWGERIERLLLASFMALVVIAPLSPSDTPAGLGIFVVQAMLWTALGVCAIAHLALSAKQPVRWSAIDLVALLYLGWTLLSMLAVRGVGDMRAAINGFFQTTAFVLAIILGRHLLVTRDRRRDALAVLLSLAVALAWLGLLQAFLINPLEHARVRAHPEEVLMPQGIVDPQSPEARRFLDRYLSPEPLATFTLTNSLASFLVPWIIVLVAAGWSAWRKGVDRRSLALAAIAVASLAACLLLTKSRTGILSTLLGLSLLIAANSRLGQRINWRWWAGGALAAALLVVGVWTTGKLDRQVLTEAPTSVLYRLQYWQSTWNMIRDHFVFGCGPGNFRSVYARYKLPEASEEIGDPHNFLLEIWATAGTPALVLFGLLLLLIFWRRRTDTSDASTPFTVPSNGFWLLGGAVAGLLISVLANFLVDAGSTMVGPVPAAWLIGLPVVVAGFFLLRPLLTDELIDGSALPIAVAALLINLLAAGGIGFPNVNMPLALLLAFCASPSLVRSSHSPAPDKPGASVSRSPWSYAAMAVAVVLSVGCFLTCYWPVLRATGFQTEAAYLQAQRQGGAALQALAAAAQADPFNPEPCVELAKYEMQRFIDTRSGDARESLDAAVEEAVRRNPRSYLIHHVAGQIYLKAYRASGRQPLLNQAIEHYSAAVARYPNFSLLHARLAWAHHLAGDAASARREAREALRLDGLCPHEDKQLRSHRLDDEGAPVRDVNARLDELMQRLAGERGT